jgi:hypothetical protein
MENFWLIAYFLHHFSSALYVISSYNSFSRSRRGDPMSIFMAVVFPAPFAPRKPKISFIDLKMKLSTAVKLPNFLLRFYFYDFSRLKILLI